MGIHFPLVWQTDEHYNIRKGVVNAGSGGLGCGIITVGIVLLLNALDALGKGFEALPFYAVSRGFPQPARFWF
jgi:hypothetical protein